ncbi:MAG: DUF1684 domain-containing protein [Rhodocyclaceae bacterium]|nr:DUF1684 domain-containing protein [Rhodocyclaceae bacterium]
MQTDFELWRQKRLEELSAPEGWLSLIGLFWLEPGTNAVGSAPSCPVQLPQGPELLGALHWEASGIIWKPAPGCAAGVEGRHAAEADGSVPLDTDEEGKPSLIRLGDLSLFILEREGRIGVRLRDRAWAEKQPFAGLACHAFDPDWRIAARWQPLSPPLAMEVPTMTGEIKTVSVRHQAVFFWNGRELSLLPLEEDPNGVFFVFRDETSGKETYGGGRFLRTEAPRDGSILLDFNRAYNPPCAFTPFAACPLPPPENRLPFPVAAGEKKYLGK